MNIFPMTRSLGFIMLNISVFIAVIFSFSCKNDDEIVEGFITQGVIEYDITYPYIDKKAEELPFFLPKKAVRNFNEKYDRLDINVIVGNVAFGYIINEEDFSFTQYSNIFAEKFYSESLKEDIKKTADLEVVETQETKKIAGYICEKAIVHAKRGGKDHQFAIYYTKKIKDRNQYTFQYQDVSGMLLAYEYQQNKVTIRLEAQRVKPSVVKEKVFEMDKTIYTKMSQEKFEANIDSIMGNFL